MAEEFVTEIYDDDTSSAITHADDDADWMASCMSGSSADIFKILAHTMAILLFASLGLFGNGLTIHIYRKKTQASRRYILALAVVDIATLLILLPVWPFMEMFRENYRFLARLVVYVRTSVTFLYLWILLAITAERTVAVFQPLTLKRWRKRIQMIVFSLSLSHLITQMIVILVDRSEVSEEKFARSVMRAGLVFATLTIAFILAAYSAIIYKLVNLGKQHHMMSVKHRSQHLTAVKVCVALVLLLVVSYLPSILLHTGVVPYFSVTYMYFFNHIGNPVAYYVISKNFRRDVAVVFRESMAKLKA